MTKKTCCCGLPSWADGQVETAVGTVIRAATRRSPRDRRGALRCRLSDRFRSKYRVTPGVYAAGNPTPASPLLATSNYKMSFDELRTSLAGIDAWILVLDTKGINVWCAAGKGTFGTHELVRRMEAAQVSRLVSHRRIMLPQLGASGVRAHEVTRASGFSVVYGPVRAADIPGFLAAGCVATPSMRTVTFATRRRLALVPMELLPTMKRGLLVIGVIAAVMGLSPAGILFRPAVTLAAPVALALFCAIIAGAALHPLLLPLFPMRAFTIQGALLGAAAAVPFVASGGLDVYVKTAIGAGMPLVSSYLAFNFTGCTTFTNKSGVKKELRRIWPFYAAAALVTLAGLVLCKLRAEGVIR